MVLFGTTLKVILFLTSPSKVKCAFSFLNTIKLELFIPAYAGSESVVFFRKHPQSFFYKVDRTSEIERAAHFNTLTLSFYNNFLNEFCIFRSGIQLCCQQSWLRAVFRDIIWFVAFITCLHWFAVCPDFRKLIHLTLFFWSSLDLSLVFEFNDLYFFFTWTFCKSLGSWILEKSLKSLDEVLNNLNRAWFSRCIYHRISVLRPPERILPSLFIFCSTSGMISRGELL